MTTVPGPDASLPVPPAVVRLGMVSLLTDVAGDLIATLLPFFLVGTLGASFGLVGVIDGTAEAMSSLLKIASGRLGDGRVPKKRLVLIGYAIAALARPLIGLAASPLHVLAIRVIDRTGKGIRTAPRDAWIADVTPEGGRGAAFGVHRAMDNAGAFLGPVIALLLYRGLGLPLPTIFALTIIPGALAVLILAATKEPPPRAVAPVATPVAAGPLPPRLRAFLVVAFVFALACSSDTFVLLLGRSIVHDETWVLTAWIGFALLRTLLSGPGSRLSDRIGRRATLLLGWALYAACYLSFSWASSFVWWLVTLAAYAGFYGLTEGAERALVADLSEEGRRGAAFGWFHGVVGAALLPASLGFGAIVDQVSFAAAFRVSAAIAVVAALGLMLVLRTWPSRPKEPSAPV